MREKIINTETIKINVPESLNRSITNDMHNFEVFKRDGETVNFNGFMSSLIAGYYERYQEEISEQTKRTEGLLSKYIKDKKQLEQATSDIIVEELTSETHEKKETNSKSLKFRSTTETDGIILEIEEKLESAKKKTSRFFRMMLFSYSRNPVFVRERIIYYRNTDVIEEACRSGKEITFTIRDNPSFLHKVVPYGIKHGSDEQFNYLLCQEYNQDLGRMVAMSYRLCRIVNPRITTSKGIITAEIKAFLKKMEELAPQYAIMDDQKTCIEFTPAGKKSFQRLYQGRPVVADKGAPDSNGNVKFYFTCSQDQLFLYLRRFNPGEANILYPEELKKRLVEFHQEHLSCLKQ